MNLTHTATGDKLSMIKTKIRGTGLSDELTKFPCSAFAKTQISGGNKNGSEEEIISRHRTLGRA
jgi:hypothetical protein